MRVVEIFLDGFRLNQWITLEVLEVVVFIIKYSLGLFTDVFAQIEFHFYVLACHESNFHITKRSKVSRVRTLLHKILTQFWNLKLN